MNWMTWLLGRCVDLSERVGPGPERRSAPRPPRDRAPGSGTEPAIMRPLNDPGRR